MPPTAGEDRERAALFPVEVVTLLSCKDISRARRRVYWLAIFTAMRRSELERLTAADVDLEHELITVRGKKTSAAKRQVPIEPGLRPLLVALLKARKTGGASDLVKRDLERADLT